MFDFVKCGFCRTFFFRILIIFYCNKNHFLKRSTALALHNKFK